MSIWYRVFGMSEIQPTAEELLAHLRGQGMPVVGKFQGDEQGWFHGDLILSGADLSSHTLHLNCWLAKERGVRADLNAWAAWLETRDDNPNSNQLMTRLIGTMQVFTLHADGSASQEVPAEAACLELCRFLALETVGVYQVDGRGFYAADGKLLVGETLTACGPEFDDQK